MDTGLKNLSEFCAISDRGGRADNQDRVLADPSLSLFAVADGMGGHQGGAVAAELALSELRSYVESPPDVTNGSWPFGYCSDVSEIGNRLSTAIGLANRSVMRQAESAPEYAGMGTTIAAILLREGTAFIANVGDSRVYRFREGELAQLTLDDTMAQSPLGALLIDEEARREMQHVLMQAIGSQETVDVHIREERLLPRDLFLLTSDGLHGTIDDAAIGAILCQCASIDKCTAQLLEAAVERGTSDNVSVILLGYDR